MFSGALITAISLAAPQDVDLKKRAEVLVAHLGDASFRDREKAARELLVIGYAAKDAVLAGQKSRDAEISERCKKLYPVIWRTDLEKRLQKFQDDPEGAVPEDLPGATKWVKLAGDGKASRELYAEMVKAHPEALIDVELHPDRLPQAYADLAKEVYTRTFTRPSPVPAGGVRSADESEVLLFLFLGAVGEPRPTIPRGVSTTYVYQFLNSPALQSRLGTETADASFRRLYAAWLEKERYSLILRRGIDVAAQHKVRECVPMIVRIAGDSGTLVTVRATALLGLGRLGTKDDIKDLAPLLKSEVQVCQTVFNGDRGTVQMRDVALAAAIHLAGQDPHDFGFERRAPAGALNVSYIYYAFTSDEKRAAAHDKWEKWAAEYLKK